MQSTQVLSRLLADAERGEIAALFPSGTAALCMALLTCLDERRRLLLPVHCYPPLIPALHALQKIASVEVAYYEPLSIDALQAALTPDTAVVLLETFASWTFESVDIAAAARICRKNGTRLIVDNSAATPLVSQPLLHGADFVVHSLAKYLSANCAFGGVCIAAAGAPARTLSRVRRLGFVQEQFPANEASVLLEHWETLGTRIESARTNTGEVISQLKPLSGIETAFFPGATEGQRRGFPSMLSLRHSLPRDVVEVRAARGLPIEVGSGWGGLHNRILLVPPDYWNLRSVFKNGAMARIYIGSASTDGVIEAINTLFS